MDARHILCFLLVQNIFVNSAPIEDTTVENNDNSTEELYVIRAIVYEVGILTPEDNSTDESEEMHEEVNLTFFDPAHNGSMIDLAEIPIPLQTNVSGQVITGLAPVNLGSVQLPVPGANQTVFTPSADNFTLPQALVSVTTNVSTTNSQTGSGILQGLPTLLGLPQI